VDPIENPKIDKRKEIRLTEKSTKRIAKPAQGLLKKKIVPKDFRYAKKNRGTLGKSRRVIEYIPVFNGIPL
jgi:sensor histidine kinase regulating citrate/malate metabolism